MGQPYRDFTDLVIHTTKGEDYRLLVQDRGMPITIAAIHGGGIEPLTSELAAAIAGEARNLYDFRGIRSQDNEILRVPVQRFDEMHLRELLRRSHTVLAIEGVGGEDMAVHLGGRNRLLKALLSEHLQQAGFAVRGPLGPGAAHDPMRFYNRTGVGGVQLELPRSLRLSMLDCALEQFAWEDPVHWREAFHTLVAAAQSALERYQAEARGNLDATLARFERATRALKAFWGSDDHRCN